VHEALGSNGSKRDYLQQTMVWGKMGMSQMSVFHYTQYTCSSLQSWIGAEQERQGVLETVEGS
jgi:hypothetical protein